MTQADPVIGTQHLRLLRQPMVETAAPATEAEAEAAEPEAEPEAALQALAVEIAARLAALEARTAEAEARARQAAVLAALQAVSARLTLLEAALETLPLTEAEPRTEAGPEPQPGLPPGPAPDELPPGPPSEIPADFPADLPPMPPTEEPPGPDETPGPVPDDLPEGWPEGWPEDLPGDRPPPPRPEIPDLPEDLPEMPPPGMPEPPAPGPNHPSLAAAAGAEARTGREAPGAEFDAPAASAETETEALLRAEIAALETEIAARLAAATAADTPGEVPTDAPGKATAGGAEATREPRSQPHPQSQSQPHPQPQPHPQQQAQPAAPSAALLLAARGAGFVAGFCGLTPLLAAMLDEFPATRSAPQPPPRTGADAAATPPAPAGTPAPVLARGRIAPSPAAIPLAGWRDILRRCYVETQADRVPAVAAGVTFYVLLALFPALTALVSLYGLVADRATVLEHLAMLDRLMPAAAVALIRTQLDALIATDSSTLTLATVLGLLLAIWSANGGVKAMIEALNVAYGEVERRGFFRLNAWSLVLTLGGLVTMVSLLGLAAALPPLLAELPTSRATDGLLLTMRWPAMLLCLLGVLSVLYRFGPSRATARWRWVTPGALVATLLLVAGSMGFSWYAASFGSYDRTYGALGAVVVLLVWVWISTIIVLLGAELNAETERQTLRDSTTGPPLPLGRRGAHAADTLGH